MDEDEEEDKQRPTTEACIHIKNDKLATLTHTQAQHTATQTLSGEKCKKDEGHVLSVTPKCHRGVNYWLTKREKRIKFEKYL